jgi:hypothetical protein
LEVELRKFQSDTVYKKKLVLIAAYVFILGLFCLLVGGFSPLTFISYCGISFMVIAGIIFVIQENIEAYYIFDEAFRRIVRHISLGDYVCEKAVAKFEDCFGITASGEQFKEEQKKALSDQTFENIWWEYQLAIGDKKGNIFLMGESKREKGIIEEEAKIIAQKMELNFIPGESEKRAVVKWSGGEYCLTHIDKKAVKYSEYIAAIVFIIMFIIRFYSEFFR